MASLSSDNTNGVFIDTNLDTHFATVVSDHDSVSDLKKIIKSEHPSHFPKFGPINIHAIKVKRKRCFYHLTDSTCVRDVFNGSKKSWFLNVEASALGECAQSDQLILHASPNQVTSLDNLQLLHSLSSDNTNIVFIDTNLDTHLATVVSDHDTVSDLKKRIKSEHPSHFPKFWPINIHAIKVKCKGCFYPLVDSMCVRDAFNGSKKSWFLSVEASALGEGAQSDQLVPHASPNQVASLDNLQLLQLENKQGEGQGIDNVSSCVSEQTDRAAVKNLKAGVKSVGNNEDGIPVHGFIPEAEERGFVNREVLPSVHIQCEVDGSGTSIKDVCDVREDDLSISVPSAKRKRKSKMKRRRAHIKELNAWHQERPGKGKRTICSDCGVSVAAGKSCKERRTDTLNAKDGAISCLSGGVTIDYLPDNNSSGPDAGIFNKKRSTTGGSDENELIKSTTLFVEDTPLVPQTSIGRSSTAEKSKDCDQKIEHAATTDQKSCSLTIPCDNLASSTLIPMDQELPDI